MAPNIGVMELCTDSENIYNEASLAKYCNANVTIFTTRFLYERVSPFFKNDKDDYTPLSSSKSLEVFLLFVEESNYNHLYHF